MFDPSHDPIDLTLDPKFDLSRRKRAETGETETGTVTIDL